MTDATAAPIGPTTGLAVLHLFCKPLPLLDGEAVVAAVKACEATGHQVVTASMLGHKADLAFMVLGPDWRELRRWGISEDHLPPGSTVLFRQPNIWEEYKAYILSAAALLALQSALIAGLMIQRARRRRMEYALRENERRLHATVEQNQDLAGRLITAQEAERTSAARQAQHQKRDADEREPEARRQHRERIDEEYRHDGERERLRTAAGAPPGPKSPRLVMPEVMPWPRWSAA